MSESTRFSLERLLMLLRRSVRAEWRIESPDLSAGGQDFSTSTNLPREFPVLTHLPRYTLSDHHNLKFLTFRSQCLVCQLETLLRLKSC